LFVLFFSGSALTTQGYFGGELASTDLPLIRGSGLAPDHRNPELVAAAFSGLLDQLPLGTALGDPAGRLLWWNRYASELFDARDGLWLEAGSLRTSLPEEGERVSALIRHAAAPRAILPPGQGAMSITRPSLRRSYAVLVSPVARTMEGSGQALAAVLITDPERDLSADAHERLGRQFGLTPAEARVAALLLQGRSVETAADHLAVSVATARTHVRSLLQKTGAARQSELVRILLTGPSVHSP